MTRNKYGQGNVGIERSHPEPEERYPIYADKEKPLVDPEEAESLRLANIGKKRLAKIREGLERNNQ